jgi:toxin ParE1/3/4
MGQTIWTNFATSELKSIYLYYKLTVSITVADNIKKNIFHATKQIIKRPLIGVIEENLINFKQEHRYIIVGNYKIIYRIIEKDIYITDIFDCRQNPKKMKEHHHKL